MIISLHLSFFLNNGHNKNQSGSPVLYTVSFKTNNAPFLTVKWLCFIHEIIICLRINFFNEGPLKCYCSFL